MYIFCRYSRFFAGIFLFLCACSCAEEKDTDALTGELRITGTVYDYDDPESGISDIMVVLSSYEAGDRNFKFPIVSDTTYTDDSGAFVLRAASVRESWKYRLTARDTMLTRPGGTYHATSAFNPVLHVEFNRHSYDAAEGVYRMDNVNIPVTRK